MNRNDTKVEKADLDNVIRHLERALETVKHERKLVAMWPYRANGDVISFAALDVAAVESLEASNELLKIGATVLAWNNG